MELADRVFAVFFFLFGEVKGLAAGVLSATAVAEEEESLWRGRDGIAEGDCELLSVFETDESTTGVDFFLLFVLAELEDGPAFDTFLSSMVSEG